MLWLGWGDRGPAFPLLPAGRCLAVSQAGGEDGAHMQEQLPDIFLPKPGLKGAVVPFAAGEAGRTGRVCVRSATPAASSPKGRSPPKIPLELGNSPVLEQWLVQTPVRSCWLLGPPALPCGSFYPKKGSSQRAMLLTHGASLGEKLQLGTQHTSSTAGDGGHSFVLKKWRNLEDS